MKRGMEGGGGERGRCGKDRSVASFRESMMVISIYRGAVL